MTSQTVEQEPYDEEQEPAAPRTYSLLARLGAEFFGTFVLVLAIVAVLAFRDLAGGSTGALSIAIAGGLAFAVMIGVLGHVSGAHLNPAISLGAAITGRLAWSDLLPYWVVQVLGGVAAGGVVRVLVPQDVLPLVGREGVADFMGATANGFGENAPLADLTASAATQAGIAAPTFTLAQALVVEAALSAVLVAVALVVARRASTLTPVLIGATLAIGILVAGPITNAGLNPARSTSVVLFAEPAALSQLWLFWVAPLLGAAVAALVVTLVAPAAEPAAEWDDEDDDVEDPGTDDHPDGDHVHRVDAVDPDPADLDDADSATSGSSVRDATDPADVELEELPDADERRS